MASGYPFQDIEKKWQDAWERDGVYHAKDGSPAEHDRKFYGLIEFPYPSGEGLHVGHPRSYVAIDIMTRKRRMEGKNVLYPIGWDAFGLPTENFAIKHKINPAEATKKNVGNFKRQIMSLGIGFDWSREINTTDPAYYKWTQWMFLKFFQSYFDETGGRAKPIELLVIPADVQSKGEDAIREYRDSKRMAYKGQARINWCPRCKIGLANEEAQGGVCERCGNPVEERTKSQWMIRITAYAERLVKDLDTVDYLERIKAQQVNWIGKSEGAYVDFSVLDAQSSMLDTLTVFTTRPDTLFGATYLVLAPEHPLITTWLNEGKITNTADVRAYQEGAKLKSDLQRQENKEKTGVALQGITATNPANGEQLPVWIADYVLGGYGTGAIMAVPAHDQRDLDFAKMFSLKIFPVIANEKQVKIDQRMIDVNKLELSPLYGWESTEDVLEWIEKNGAMEDDQGGIMINSGFLTGTPTAEAKTKIIEWLEKEQKGQKMTTYRLRDWVFSRQRYWGEPIPMVHCDACGYVPVPEAQLPVVLPPVEKYEPTDSGESPLAAITEWVATTCPTCGKPATRETDTMPNWAGSSWYFLRYCDPHNTETFAAEDKLKFWMPVDLYNGGMEHTTLHLLYSRFWYKFMWDLGLIPHECGSEPYARRRSHALILAQGGVKMSKSKGNVVNPDEVVGQYGADVFRTYEMFIGPFDADAPWDTNGIEGVKRFLEKVWNMYQEATGPAEAHVFRSRDESRDEKTLAPSPVASEILLHQTIKKVGDDIEAMRFNTCVSAMMILANVLASQPLTPFAADAFLKILAPFAPHLADELWRKRGNTTSIHLAEWPSYDASKLTSAEFELVVQINGKVRDKMTVASDISEEDATTKALASEKIRQLLGGATPEKVVYVKGRLVSISVQL